MNVKEVKLFANDIRRETIKCIGHLGVGHVGGALSIVDVLAVLYSGVMNIDPADPKKDDRDFLVCSKGHAGPAVYSTLALKGYFPMEMLLTLNQLGTNLPSHCDMNRTPGIDMTTGSLGQGSSTAMGIACGNRLKGLDNYTYLILGDGEINEGQVWEAALFANAKKLDHVIAFVDYNKLQLDDFTDKVCPLLDIAAKFESFGWYGQDIDGHDVEAIAKAIDNAKKSGKPSVIVLNTIKGKGYHKIENSASNHNMNISAEQTAEALAGIAAERAAIEAE